MSLFDNVVCQFRTDAIESVEHLKTDTLNTFVDLSNDCIDLLGKLVHTCPHATLDNSLTWTDVTAVFKQLYAMNFDFLCGRYVEIERSLRFMWESIARATYTDCFSQIDMNQNEIPGESLDSKIEWLKRREGKLNWNRVIRPTLVFAGYSPDEIEENLNPLWMSLHEAVHPSCSLREVELLITNRHVAHLFNKDLALLVANKARTVYSVVERLVENQFPQVR